MYPIWSRRIRYSFTGFTVNPVKLPLLCSSLGGFVFEEFERFFQLEIFRGRGFGGRGRRCCFALLISLLGLGDRVVVVTREIIGVNGISHFLSFDFNGRR